MRRKGISYDTGFLNAGVSTYESFDSEIVKREMGVIRDDLHCTAVRVTGGDPERLEIAAKHAAELGLEVWFSPFTCDLTQEQMLAFLADCGERAERLRLTGAEVVLVTGAEMSLFNVGFLPGETIGERLPLLGAPPAQLRELLAAVPARINAFLAEAAAVVRARFGGKISYASMPFEKVDWSPFDFVSVDAYRSLEIADRYRDGIRALVAQGKPVAITEFGCATHRGAADKGARGGFIVEWDGPRAVRLDDDYTRDESEQVGYLRELLDIFEAEGIDVAFVQTFACYHLPHREEARRDLDMASYGIVKVFENRRGETYPDMPWEPKAAFAALAERYRVHSHP